MVPAEEGTGTVAVRRLRAEDWPEFRALRLRALATDPLAFGSTREAEAGRPESRWRESALRGAGSSAEATWVAVGPEGRLLGMAGLFAREGRFHLWGMWVAPEARRRGVGRRLLDPLLRWAHAQDPSAEVVLEVNPVQESAVRLYRSAGFERTGESRPLGHTPGQFVNAMRLRRTDPRPAPKGPK